MKFKFILALVAMAGFSAIPALAQHGHGGGTSGGGGHDASHASSTSTSSHGGDSGKSGDKDGDSHGGGHGGHGNISAKLAANPALSAKLSALLPAGTDLNAAAAGFKNMRDFVAALHASKDLGIPFDQLKAKLTGPGSENLRKAIADLAPTANAKAAEKTAEQEAKADLHAGHDAKDAAGHDADAAGHDANDDTHKTP